MSRHIYCLTCGHVGGVGSLAHGALIPKGLDAEDILQGWTMRVVYLSNSRIPKKHGITVIATGTGTTEQQGFEAVADLRCDNCDEVITGQIVVAVSRIPPDKVMREWEPEFGELMTREAVDTYLRMAKP